MAWVAVLLAASTPAASHPPGPDGSDPHEHVQTADRASVVEVLVAAEVRAAPAPPRSLAKEGLPWQAESFAMFRPGISLRADAQWLWVEGDGLPHAPVEHPLMTGIVAWQQQVPLPQPYVGTNAWQIPLKPQLADQPIDGRLYLRRGAIALAANGIPIFNALTNRGADAFLGGELDEYGGHSGRGDDYHYHTAPLFLQKVLGMRRPIAFALDGFPIYGLFDPKAKPGADNACPLGSTEPLDAIGGHFCTVPAGQGIDGGTRGYHYHASKTYPYINGGLRGKVTVENDGVEPQPRAQGVRPALPPLRGAKIVGFRQTGPKAWSLSYAVGGKDARIDYAANPAGGWDFTFVGTDGSIKKETFSARRGGGQGRGADRPPRAEGPVDTPPPISKPVDGFVLRSAVVGADGRLPVRHTCDGEGIAPPFEWSGLPKGTVSLAIAMHHVPPGASGGGDEHSYMVLWGIPASVKGLAEAQGDLGTWGVTSQGNRVGYAPPCSQGGGEKTYVATVYALSAEPKLAAGSTTFGQLLAAIRPLTLGTADLPMTYARQNGGPGGQRGQGGGRGGRVGPGGGGPGGGGQPGQAAPPGPGANGERGTLIARMTSFKTEVPAHDHDVILVRPTRDAMTASVVASSDRIGMVEFWQDGDAGKRTTAEQPMKAGTTASFVMDGLKPDASYRYRFGWRGAAGAPVQFGEENSFETVRSAGKEFCFAIQADSHLDQGVTPEAYERTLLNIRDSGADFLVDLGDTFMTDKRGQEFRRTEAQYDAQRYWFGIACRAMPLFMVLGNHDGERGGSGGRDGDMPSWSHQMRTARFPAPVVGDAPGGMYSGRTAMRDGGASNYYAFEWGDALIVVLDPFWSTTDRIRGGQGGGGQRAAEPRGPLKPVDGSWTSTLGREQYDWLDRTLAASKSAHKFVFIHHLVGGMGGAESRGGAESVPYFEWGGKNADGSDGFAEHRPGWPMPVHDLLVKRGVSAVFHGHDHLYVHGQRDGIHYQCVPQPGNLAGGTRSAAEYGYASGTILGSPGHVRVRVAPKEATVEFVRTALAGAAGQGGRRGRDGGGAAEPNGFVADRYAITPRAAAATSPGAVRGAQDAPPGRPRKGPPRDGIVKPAMTDTVHGSMYADNWFAMWINGRLVAIDSIDFLPHNVVSIDLLPEYPMTIAVMAKDNASPTTGCEYGRQIGDGGFILKFADGTVTDARWKATCVMHGPIGRNVDDPTVRTDPVPDGWNQPGFDDSAWPNAVEYAQDRIDPKQPFFEHDFAGAKWIWTSDLDLDNTVLLRTRVEKPGWKPRWSTKPDLDASVQ
jgi:phosphatidylethanolamine-binding protein (PEBP) family uncharacterized protein